MTTVAQHEPDAFTVSARVSASRLQGKRILYVDDDPFLRRITGRFLEAAGVFCHLADTHDHALTIVGRDPELALAILDFQMPDADVGVLVKRLQTARSWLALIGTSATDRRHEFAQHGVTEFLEKPWKLGELVRAANW